MCIRVVFVNCHVASSVFVTPSLVATHQLQDNSCGSMMDGVGHTNSNVQCSVVGLYLLNLRFDAANCYHFIFFWYIKVCVLCWWQCLKRYLEMQFKGFGLNDHNWVLLELTLMFLQGSGHIRYVLTLWYLIRQQFHSGDKHKFLDCQREINQIFI